MKSTATPCCVLSILIVCVVGPVDQGWPQSPPPNPISTYDVVLVGGRVMDPETGADSVRNVAVLGGRIAEISSEPLRGKLTVDVGGLVVAPGFIDLHAHGQTNRANEFQAHDGVTTALELESGVPFLHRWVEARRGQALINYGASVSHSSVRWMVMEKYNDQAQKIGADRRNLGTGEMAEVMRSVQGARYETVAATEFASMKEKLSIGLGEGGLGIGVPVGYYPGASHEEIFRVYEFAAETMALVFTHVRAPTIAAIQEAIANAAVTGAPLHIVHVNSMSLGRIGVALDMIASAQARGLDITTELYPYTAGSTSIQSTIFDKGWQKIWGISYRDIQWVKTSERLTKATFEKYRRQGGTIIMHMMKPEWIDLGIGTPFTIIASDGMPYAPGAHPRSAGTFSRVLGRYVRERKVLTIMDALRKMTLLPARRLEDIAPSMRLKGRLQVGCDADITVFDPDRVLDTATFEDDLSFSVGVEHVLVNGTFVVRDGETVQHVFPGRAVLGRYRR